AVRAGRPADRHHARLLLLAGVRLVAPVALPRLALRRPAHLHRRWKLRPAAGRSRLLPERGDEPRLFAGGDGGGPGGGAAPRLARQREDSRAGPVSHAASLALRHRAGGGWGHLALRLSSVVRRPAVPPVVPDHLSVQLVFEGLGGADADRHRGDLEAVRLQPGLLPGRAPGHPRLGARGGQRRRGRPPPPLLRDHRPAPLAGDLLPVHAQHDLRVLRDVRSHSRGYAGRSGRRDVDPGLSRVEGRLRRPPARLLGGAVGDPDAAGDRADGRAVPVRGEEGHLLMGRSSALAHGILVASIVLLAFPLYYAFVISTQSLDEVTSLAPKLAPSTHLVQNYADAWARVGMGRLLLNSTITSE